MRLFVAVDLEPNVRKAMAEIQQQIVEPGFAMVPVQNLHITLKFLGEVSEDKVGDITERLSTIKMMPFEVEYSGIGVFPSPSYIRVVWLGIKDADTGALAKLAEAVKQALPEFPEDHPFSPHLTIARVKARPQMLMNNLQKLADVQIGRQLVDRFVLKKSTLTREGAVYEDVGVYELK